MSDIKAIETQYKGYRFRSRLEARWAVFFDALGIRWKYEPEGYDLGKAGWYLPDFWIPDLEFHVEIKPEGTVNAADLRKLNAFKGSLILLQGEPGEYTSCGFGDYGTMADLGAWGTCSICGCVRFGYRCAGEFSGTPCDCEGWSDSFDIDRSLALIDAIAAARSARFEHGEQPAIAHRGAA